MTGHITLALIPLLLAGSVLRGQTAAGSIPAGTPLAVVIDRHYPMHAGEAIEGHLLYPVYADNTLLLSKGTTLTGSVLELHRDGRRRVRAALGGDFTPFHKPEVLFNRIVLADGSTVAFASSPANDGAPMYRAVAPPPVKGGFFHQEFDAGLNVVRGDIAAFTAPGKGDRLLQFIYARLPYHPERIDTGTEWSIETAAAVAIPAEPAPPAAPAAVTHKRHIWDEPAAAASASTGGTGSWIVQANLAQTLSSQTSHAGEPIRAVVAEPLYDSDHTLAVPQGATLVGSVTRARPSRAFGRSGVLSFNFNQLVLPNAELQTVETRLTGADSAYDIALNSEGQAQSKPRDKVSIPLVLALMASRPLDQDEGRAHDTLGKNATGGAAGLSLIGTVVAIAGGSSYAAAGIGYWGAARAFYSRWIARGQEIVFPRDTRIVVETMPRRSAPITPSATP
jgi:hypothetical protein